MDIHLNTFDISENLIIKKHISSLSHINYQPVGVFFRLSIRLFVCFIFHVQKIH